MNENIDLTKILKDCPVGTEFYHVVYGRVWLTGICLDDDCPIRLSLHNGPYTNTTLTKKGTFSKDYDGECLLFPSKNQRDWSKFVPPCEFKDGDIVATNTGGWIGITTGGHAHSYMPTYCVLSYNREVKLYFGRKEQWGFSRLATEEEKQKLFQAIKDKGYKWNAETKTLEKLIEPKFDPKTLKPFDKVLVRDSGAYSWICTFYSHTKECSSLFRYVTNNSAYEFCIPYNDDTKHLVGTTEEAPEYYRYWED